MMMEVGVLCHDAMNRVVMCIVCGYWSMNDLSFDVGWLRLSGCLVSTEFTELRFRHFSENRYSSRYTPRSVKYCYSYRLYLVSRLHINETQFSMICLLKLLS